jgi:hypothetical protein
VDLETLNIRLSVPLLVGGLALAGVAFVWLYVRAARAWGWWLLLPPVALAYPFAHPRRAAGPVALLLAGLALAATPSAIARLFPIDLGPYEKLVEGQRHLTLTGWDPASVGLEAAGYELLRQKSDAAVVQMANPDVNDATLALLSGFTKLKTLDVSHSKVTDAGLERIAGLPALETVYLNDTAVTSDGVKRWLTGHPTLKVVWLRGTSVSRDAADALKAGKPGRRVVVDAKP